MGAYLTVAEWGELSIMQDADIQHLEITSPGFLEARIIARSAEVDARLSKRYATPFASLPGSEARSWGIMQTIVGPPAIVKRWVESLVTFDAFAARGFDPSSAQDEAAIVAPMSRTLDELKEAADAKDGLYNLPLNATNATSGVVYGSPVVYTEASPYEWCDVQREAVRGQ